MAPREANTLSPYLIGIRVSRHLTACMTEDKSMFNARRSCAAPTLAEWPEILSHSSFSNPIHFPTFLSTAITLCGVNFSSTPAEPRTLKNIAPSLIPALEFHSLSNRIVNGDKYAVAPSPVVSVFDRRIRTLPDPDRSTKQPMLPTELTGISEMHSSRPYYLTQLLRAWPCFMLPKSICVILSAALFNTKKL
jgi:hypothetical protein